MKKSLSKESIEESSDEPKPTSENQEYAVGCKLEARDSSGVWYAARVDDLDWNKKQILIHFERWSNKYDEWIPMASDRLRALKQPLPPKPQQKFEVGEHVLALWSAYQKYPAVVQKAFPDGKYEVLFEDGLIKKLPSYRMSHLEDSPGVSRTVVEPAIGSKQDRRDRKRKIIVSELFRSNKRPKGTPSTPPVTRTSSTVTTPVASSTFDNDATAAPEPAETETSTVPTPAYPIASTSTAASTEPETPAAVIIPTNSKSAPLTPVGIPTPIEVTFINGNKEIWQKVLTRRTEGKTAGKLEIVICSVSGRKFRCRAEIIRYCEDNKIIYEPTLFDFSAKGRAKRRSGKLPGEEYQVKIAETSEPETTKPVVAPIVAGSPLPQPLAFEMKNELIEEERKYVGNFEIKVEDGQFICPSPDCRKHFRKENLLHMHMKHYHPDLSKFLDYTPSVTDLAYARTFSGLENDTSPIVKTPIRAETRSSDVKRSPVRIKDCRVELKNIPVNAATSSTTAADSTGQINPDGSSVQQPSMVEVSPAMAVHAEKSNQRNGSDGIVGSTSCTPSLPKPKKIHWKCRPHRRNHIGVSEWYGRMEKQALAAGGSDGTGKLSGEEGDLVQRNPILNTLLSSRPLAPTLGWRAGWRRQRRVGWNKRRSSWTKRRAPRHPHTPTALAPAPVKEELDIKDGILGAGLDVTEETLVKPIPVPIEDLKYDKLRGNEIINCACQLKEEDGLMIQCDVCQCWQHGHCLGISPEDSVPETYVCTICKDPHKGRSSKKYYNNQEMMKHGTLPSLPFSTKNSQERRNFLKRAFDTSGQLSMLSRLLHCLRVKLSVASTKNHPKLWLWAQRWQQELISTSDLPKVKEEAPDTPKAPEPEKPIDSVECKLNLLDHIRHYQTLVQERLNDLEAQIDELEASEDKIPDDSPMNYHNTVKMLLRDMDTVKKIVTLP